MIKRISILIFLAVLSYGYSVAQTTEAQKKEINRIKKNTSQYIYAEVTTTDKNTAIELAEEALYAEINKYVAKKKSLSKSTNIVTRNTKSSWETISLPRGNMYRAFIYVKKTDIIPADNAKVTETPKSEPTASKVEPLSKYEETISRLQRLKRFSELESCLKQLKQEGRISDFGKIKTLSDPKAYVLIIYNKAGDIEAVLSEGANRTNLKTGDTDNEKNYTGRGAFGVKVNK